MLTSVEPVNLPPYEAIFCPPSDAKNTILALKILFIFLYIFTSFALSGLLLLNAK